MAEIKNGIIIKGIAYKVRKQSVGVSTSFVCKKCDLKRKCGEIMGAGPCLIYEDKTHEAYFKKIKEE